MAREIVTVDLDDVLVSTAEWIIERYNRDWGTQLTLADWYSPHGLVWGDCDEVEAIRRVDRYCQSEAFFELEPDEETILAVEALARVVDLHILTGRNDIVTAPTRQMVQRSFPGAFQAIHFSNMFDKARARSKGELCQIIGAACHIDDHIPHCASVAGGGLARAVLFGDYPWNRASSLPERITRCVDWPAVLEYFEHRQG